MTAPVEDIERLLAEAGFTRLVADYVPDSPDLEGVEPGWRIHDFPPDTIFAMFLADGLDEPQAKAIVAAVNRLPQLLATIRTLEAENVRLALLAANGAPVLQQLDTEEQDALVDFIKSLRDGSALADMIKENDVAPR